MTRTLKTLLISFSLCVLTLALPSQIYAETEPNDTPGQANPLVPGATGDTNATLSSNTDVDWFTVAVEQDHWYIFETYNVSANVSTRLRLYAPDGTTQLANVYGSGTGNTYSRIAWQAPADGSYYLLVSSSSGAGPYSIRALEKYDEGATWDVSYEPNDTWQTAHEIVIGRDHALNTTIYPRGPYTTVTGDYDFFRFEAVFGHWYTIETFNVASQLDTRLELFNVNGDTQLDNDYDGGTGNADARILWQAPQTGTFYIRVIAETSSMEGAYSLRVLPKYDEGASWDGAWEPDDTWATASPLPLNQPQTRNIYPRGSYKTNIYDVDYFYFAAHAGYEYTFNLDSVAATLRANLYILSLDGSTVLISDATSTNPGTPKSLIHTFYTSGLYYILVRPYSGSYDDYGSYRLEVSTQGSPRLFVSNEELRFVSTQGAGNPAPEPLVVANLGTGTIPWDAVADQTWLHLSAANGSAGSPAILEAAPDISGLSPGDYTAQITVTAAAAGSPQLTQVSLRVDDPLTPLEEVESNDIVSLASPLTIGRLTPTNARLSSSNDIDWYEISVVQNHWYVFETYNVSRHLTTRLRLYATDGTTQLVSAYGTGTGNTYSRITWQAPSNGTYYLLVSRSGGTAGPYTIRALEAYNQGITWDGFQEINDTWHLAHWLGVGREHAVSSSIYPRGPYSTVTGDYDFYRFDGVLGNWYVIETYNLHSALDTRIELYNVDGVSSLDYDYDSGTGDTDARILWQAPQTGTFFIRVIAESSGLQGGYSLRVLPKYDEGASWDSHWEPDDTWITASPIILNQTLERNIYQRGNFKTNSADYDIFRFYAQAGHEYDVSLTSVGPTLRANLYILSLDGLTVLASDSSSTNPGTPKTLNYTFATPGNYYVRVRPYSSSYDDYGDYALRVTSVVPAIHVNFEDLTINVSPTSGSSSHFQLAIENSGFGSFAWSIAASESWLQVSPTNGTAPPSINVEVWAETTGLALGTYTGNLTISADGVDNSPYTIPVTLNIAETYPLYLPAIKR